MHAGSFRSVAPSPGRSGGQFAHGNNFAGRSGNNFAGRTGNNFAGRTGNNFAGRTGNNFAGRYGNHQWDNYFRGGYRGYGGYGGYGLGYGAYAGYGGYGGYGDWGGGGYSPWYAGWGLGSSWGYPYGSGYYPSYYPYTNDYYYSYAPTIYGGDSYVPPVYGDTSASVDSGITAPQQFADSSATAPPISEEGGLTTGPAEGQQGTNAAMNYYSEARGAFLHGDYQDALRLANHAGVEAPQNPKAHELISLALFALGNYGPAASEAHAAMALGPIADWNDLFGYYNDAAKYTAQLRALEKASAQDPKSAAEHFLLGYHYLMIRARDNAKIQFADAVKLTPGDKLAVHLLDELRSNSPLTSPETAARLRGQAL